MKEYGSEFRSDYTSKLDKDYKERLDKENNKEDNKEISKLNNSEDKKENKWDTISWNKDSSVEKKESKRDKIDWNKDRSEEKEIEGYKNNNPNDIMMTNWLNNFDKDYEDNSNKDINKLRDLEENIVNDKNDLDKDFIGEIGITRDNKKKLRKETIIREILNGNSSTIQNFNEYLKENLYKNKQLRLSEKSKIINLTQHKSLTQEEKAELTSILEKFTTYELEMYKNKELEDLVNPSQKIKMKVDNDDILIKSFPKVTRNILCEEIYRNLKESKEISDAKIISNLIKDIYEGELNREWLKQLPKDEFLEMSNKLRSDLKFKDSLNKYFNDLTNLIRDMKNLNDNNQKINFSKLSKDLIEENRGLNLTKRGLEDAIASIYNHLKKSQMNEFVLERKKSKSMIGSESEKESIRCLKKEFKLINEMYEGQFKGKCSNLGCKTNIKRLPAFEFDHTDPNIKTTTWNDIMHKDYYEIRAELEKEKAIPICRNCHSMKSSKIYNDFENIITKNNLFNYSSNEINKLVTREVENFINQNETKYSVASLKYEVNRWIKKRAVLEQLFDGKCIVCEEKRLPTLQTHHTNPDIKEHKWSEISKNWNIKELIEDFVIKEEIVFICGNCHAMESTKNFENHIEEILGVENIQEIQDDYVKIHRAIAKHTERIKKIKNGYIDLQINDYLNED